MHWGMPLAHPKGSQSRSLTACTKKSLNAASRRVAPWAILLRSYWNGASSSSTATTSNEPQRVILLRFFNANASRSIILETLIEDLNDQFIHRPASCCNDFLQVLCNGRRHVDINLLRQFAGIQIEAVFGSGVIHNLIISNLDWIEWQDRNHPCGQDTPWLLPAEAKSLQFFAAMQATSLPGGLRRLGQW